MKTWQSLAATLSAWLASAVAVLWPGHSVPPSVQVVVLAIAGLLSAQHVGLPAVLSKVDDVVTALTSSTTTGAEKNLLDIIRANHIPAEQRLGAAIQATVELLGANAKIVTAPGSVADSTPNAQGAHPTGAPPPGIV